MEYIDEKHIQNIADNAKGRRTHIHRNENSKTKICVLFAEAIAHAKDADAPKHGIVRDLERLPVLVRIERGLHEQRVHAANEERGRKDGERALQWPSLGGGRALRRGRVCVCVRVVMMVGRKRQQSR